VGDRRRDRPGGAAAAHRSAGPRLRRPRPRPDLAPAPFQVPGQLAVSGRGLARGYWRRPELTAQSFVPHPWAVEPGQRLYLTGDLVRFRADGQLEFLARIDQQVKLRGFRIELGEIEAALVLYPGVRESIALVRDDVPGEKRLVAYLVPARQPGPTGSELRAFLQAKLPDYMVPSAFVALEAIPLTGTGKADRRACRRRAGRRVRARRHARRSSAWWRRSGPRPSGSAETIWGWRTTSSPSAATRWWPPGWWRGCASSWASSCRSRPSSPTRRWRSWPPRPTVPARPRPRGGARRATPPLPGG